MKKVSVIILNWNGEALLRKFLPSVCRYTCSELAEVVVADNGSDDGSLQMLATEFPHIRVISFPKNYGFAEGYNRAIDQVDSEYVVLLNSDIEVTPDWVQPLVEYADSHPEVSALQPKMKSFTHRDYFEYAGAAGGYIDHWGYPYCRGRIFETVEKDAGQYNSVADIFWATGACLFVRTDDYRKAGGLDVHFFAHMEEIDLCWRLNRMGKRIVCVPQSTVYHVGGATLQMGSSHKIYLNFRNNMLMLYKNLPVSERRHLMLKRKMLDGLAAMMFLLKGKLQNCVAVYHAHRDATKMIEKYYRQNPVASLPVHVQKSEYYNRSIVVDYYLRRKRFFSELK